MCVFHDDDDDMKEDISEGTCFVFEGLVDFSFFCFSFFSSLCHSTTSTKTAEMNIKI
jgi:hypothetical protein